MVLILYNNNYCNEVDNKHLCRVLHKLIDLGYLKEFLSLNSKDVSKKLINV